MYKEKVKCSGTFQDEELCNHILGEAFMDNNVVLATRIKPCPYHGGDSKNIHLTDVQFQHCAEYSISGVDKYKDAALYN